jgi:hypothetical protein
MKNKSFSEAIFCFYRIIYPILSLALAITIFVSVIVIAKDLKENKNNVVEEPHICPTETINKIYVEFPLTTDYPEFVETENEAELLELMDMYFTREKAANQILIAARELGYKDSHPIIQLAKWELNTAVEMQVKYQEVYDSLNPSIWEEKMNEYPTATTIWLYLKELGYNDYVCAGIMGNIMAEVGGHTLDIQPHLYGRDNGYYGICQWSKKYYPEIHGASFNEQLDFLRDTIQKEINSFGHFHYEGFNYTLFLQLEDVEDAALAFARTYERCNPTYHARRVDNALIAFEYFVK